MWPVAADSPSWCLELRGSTTHVGRQVTQHLVQQMHATHPLGLVAVLCAPPSGVGFEGSAAASRTIPAVDATLAAIRITKPLGWALIHTSLLIRDRVTCAIGAVTAASVLADDRVPGAPVRCGLRPLTGARDGLRGVWDEAA